MSFEGMPTVANQALVWDGAKFVPQTLLIPSLRRTPNDGFTFLRWGLDETVGSTSFASSGSVASALNVVSGTIRAGRSAVIVSASARGAVDFAPPSFIRTVTQGTAVNPSSSAFSVHGWVKLRTIGGFQRFCSKWFQFDGINPTVAPEAWALLANGAGLYAQTNSAGSNKATAGVGTRGLLPLNDWAHIASTFNAGTVKIYINGSLEQTDATFPATVNFNGASGGSWSLGECPANTANSDCELSDWVVDSGIERSQAYFKALYNLATSTT